MLDDVKKLSGAGGLAGGGSPTVVPDNLISADVVEFVLGICEGPIAGLVEGPKSFYLDDTPLVSQSGDVNFDPFNLDVYHGDATPSTIRSVLGGTTSNRQVGVQLAQMVPVTRTTSASLRGQIDKLEIRIVFNSLYKGTEEGDQLENTAELGLRYREAGASDWIDFYPNNQTIQIKGKTTGGYTKEFVKRVPRIDGDWEIQVIKYNDEDDPYVVSEMTWESFQQVTIEDKAYENLAVVHGLGKASDQFSSIPQFTGVYGCKLIKVPSNYDPITRYYDGAWDGTFKIAHSDNPAWCFYDLLMDTTYGLRRYYPHLRTDRFSIYDAARWCDDLVPRPGGGYQPRFTYNDKIDQPRNALELLFQIAGIFGGVPTSDMNGTVRLKVDRPGLPVQLFGPESVTAEGFQYAFSDVVSRPNDINVKFINPNLEFEEDVRRIFDQELIDKNGRIQSEIVALGCNDVYEAQRRAMRRLIQANTEITTVTFQTARMGLGLELFDLIGISDPHMLWGVTGRAKSHNNGVIHLRDPLFLPVNTPMTMTVQTNSGPQDITVTADQAAATSLTITEGAWPNDAPARAQFALSLDGQVGLVKPFRILQIAEDSENPELMTITALEQNINKYADADNMTMSDSVNYGYRAPTAPIKPTILRAESGDGHVILGEDGSVNNRILVTLDADPSSMTKSYVIHYRKGPDYPFEMITSRTFEVYIPNVEVGVEYEIKAQIEAANGDISKMSDVITHTPTADTIAPPKPTNWSATNSLGTVVLRGDPSPAPDFREFWIYGAKENNNAVAFINRTSSTHLTLNLEEAGEFTRFKIEAVDKAGNVSPRTGFFSATYVGEVTQEDLTQDVQDEIAAARDTADDVREDHDNLVDGFTRGTLAQLEVDYSLAEDAVEEAERIQGVVEGIRDRAIEAETASNQSAVSASVAAEGALGTLISLRPDTFEMGEVPWTDESTGSTFEKDTPPSGRFVLDDAEFGAAYVTPTSNVVVGPRHPVRMDPNAIYEVEVTARVVVDDPDGQPTRMTLGMSTWTKDKVLHQANFQRTIDSRLVSDGIFTGSAMFSMRTDLNDPSVLTPNHLEGGYAFFHFRSNVGATTSGVIAVQHLSVKDVTSEYEAALSAAASIKSSEDAEAFRTDSEAAAVASQNSRVAAEAARDAAGDSADEASGYAQAAAQSSSDAQGYVTDSEAAATASEESSVNAYATLNAVGAGVAATGKLVSDFSLDGQFWTNENKYSPTDVPDLLHWGFEDSSSGRLATQTMTATTFHGLAPKHRLPYVEGNTYRLRVRAMFTGTTSVMPKFSIYLRKLDGNYNYIVNVRSIPVQFTQEGVFEEFVTEAIGEGAPAAYMMGFIFKNGGNEADDVQIKVQLLEVTDRTELVKAEAAAASAVDSRDQASAFVDDAEQYAIAASEDRVKAQTARQGAENAEGEADGYAQAAATSAEEAASSSTLAGQKAEAASEDRVKAETARTASETAKTDAEDAKEAAVLAQGYAEAAEGRAVTAEENAVAAQGQAQDWRDLSAEAAVSAAMAAQSTMPDNFTGDALNWTHSRFVPPFTGGSISGSVYVFGDDPDGGRYVEMDGTGNYVVTAQGIIPVSEGQTFLLTVEAKQSAGSLIADAAFAMQLAFSNGDYSDAWTKGEAPGFSAMNEWETFYFETTITATDIAEGRILMRPAVHMWNGAEDTDKVRFRKIAIQDVTAIRGAENSAEAALEQAGYAQSSADAASADAIAAQQFKLVASAQAVGNITGRTNFNDGEKYPWTGPVTVVGDASTWPNGEELVLRQTGRTAYSDYIEGDAAGKHLRFTGTVYVEGNFNARMGIQMQSQDGTVNKFASTDAGDKGQGIVSFDKILEVNEALTGTSKFRVILISDGDHNASAHALRWGSIVVRDVTESVVAGKHSADAGVFRDEAAQAKTDAEDAQALAFAAQEVAVQVVSNGGGILSSGFLESGINNWSTGPTFLDNEKHAIGRTLYWNIGTGNAGALITSASALWTGPVNARAFVFEIELELEAGDISGAGILFDWEHDGGGYTRSVVPYETMLGEPIVAGDHKMIRYVLHRPDTLAEDQTVSHKLYLMANYNQVGPVAGKKLKIHRVQLYTATSTDAAVKEQSSAIADLQGNASATYGLRVAAGQGVGTFEIVAFDDASGNSGSTIKLEADTIFAKGLLNADKLAIGTGRNLLRNTDFADGMLHYSAFRHSGTAWDETAVGIRGAGSSYTDGVNPVINLHQVGTNTGVSIINCNGRLRGDGSTGAREIEANEWYEFSAHIAQLNCKGEVLISWFNSAGSLISRSWGGAVDATAVTHNRPDTWPRLFVIAQAPANAKYASAGLAKHGTDTGSASYLFASKPMLAKTHADATKPSKFDYESVQYLDGKNFVTDSIFADKINTASFAASGLAVFGGAIKSANFNGTITNGVITNRGTAGFAFDNAGMGVLNDLLEREDLKNGSVSDGATFTDNVARSRNDDHVITTLTLGEWQLGQFWSIACQYKGRDRRGNEHSGGDGATTYSRDRTRVEVQMRTYNGSWSAWERLHLFDTTSTGTSWQFRDVVINKMGVYSNVQIRAKVELSNSVGSTGGAPISGQTNIDDFSLLARSVMR